MKAQNYIDDLIASCQRALQADPVKEFVLNDDSQLSGVSRAIYIIEEVGGDKEATFKKFLEYKKQKKRACPKANSPSSVLYVGSSTTSLRRRMIEHRGGGNEKTYALNLSHWFDGDYQITVKEYDEAIDVIQIIEDSLSYELSPAFGKKGGNNK